MGETALTGKQVSSALTIPGAPSETTSSGSPRPRARMSWKNAVTVSASSLEPAAIISSREADDVRQRVHGAGAIARIVDAGRQTVGDRQPALDLAQNQHSRRQTTGGHRRTGRQSLFRRSVTGRGSGRVRSTMAGRRSGDGVASFQQPNPMPFQVITLHSPTPMHNSG